MRILITGASGFMGKNLGAALQNIRQGKDGTHPDLAVEELYLYDRSSPGELLEEACRQADFVFHLAGVNRPRRAEEFMEGNAAFTALVLDTLERWGNTCPVMLASSVQAAMTGRFRDSEYGRSKQAAEELVFAHEARTGARALVYRLPNVFGKWCRPDYNSVVATFCGRVARDLPIEVHDPDTELELLYIDDLLEELLLALEGREHHRGESDGCPGGHYCAAPITHRITLGRLAALLEHFREQSRTLTVPTLPQESLEGKLYATYISYLPREKVSYPLQTHADSRGSFTRLLTPDGGGQISVNITRPGAVKGQHWHHTKWEIFVVVSGEGLIRMRRIGTGEVLEFPVSGRKLQAVYMLPGYTHSLINCSQTQDLVTVMWASEPFDPAHPDTFYEEVER